MATRQATHANSWYTGNGQKLNAELSAHLEAVKPTAEDDFITPIKGCKAIIAPHAGYSYSGPAAAWAYKSIDTTGIKRVFILGPSHHVYLDGCALSTCEQYETPLGNLLLDHTTIRELKSTGKFSEMSLETDEDEHSIEMHLPYVRKVFEGLDIAIVPILVGAISQQKEISFGKLLAPYFASPDTFFVISSDFCHWGLRFSYTSYYSELPSGQTGLVRLSRTGPKPSSLSTFPIHASISALDHEGIEAILVPPGTAAEAHNKFAAYLARTKNTICGRHPIGVLLGVLTALEGEESRKPTIKLLRYEQSSQCVNIEDSSVSYVSAAVTI